MSVGRRKTRRKGKRHSPATATARMRPPAAEAVQATRANAAAVAAPAPVRPPVRRPPAGKPPRVLQDAELGRFLSPEQQHLLKVRRAVEQREARQRRSVAGVVLAGVLLVVAAVLWLLGWPSF
ncbi:hypothetical protein [Azospirillum sp. sgz302134]